MNAHASQEETYWQWADAQLHSRCHDEALSDGTTLDVQVRLSRLGATQLFWGCTPVMGERCWRSITPHAQARP